VTQPPQPSQRSPDQADGSEKPLPEALTVAPAELTAEPPDGELTGAPAGSLVTALNGSPPDELTGPLGGSLVGALAEPLVEAPSAAPATFSNLTTLCC